MADVFVPLNAFKSIVTTLTGEDDIVYSTPNGVSTIVLSAQITNNSNSSVEEVTIKLDSNRKIPEPQLQNVVNTGSFYSASALLEINRTYIEKEAAAYVGFQNNLQDIPFQFTSSVFEERINTAFTGILYDIENGGTLRTKKAALSFYDKNGVSLITDESQLTSSYDAITYANTLSQQILKNESITGSVDVLRLYQTTFTQSYDTNIVIESGSATLVSDLLTVIADTIYDPTRVPQEKIEFISNYPIPKGDSLSPVVAGKLVLEQEFGLVFSGSQDLKIVLSILESANE
jgi:hypothetical protein|tara:strand:- start:1091 stop:1957 length:867 start_codon:yes stop_codon:yes gene_type:complete